MSATSHSTSAADLESVRLSKDTAGRLSSMGFGAGALGLLATFGALFVESLRDQALFSYLVAFFFVTTIAVGALFFTIVQHLVGAMWSVAVRRIAEIIASTLPVLVLLFIPIAANVPHLFPWAGHAAHEPAVVAKAAYLNLPFFLIRAAVYLVSWGGLGWLFYRRSLHLDQSGDPFEVLSTRKLAAPAIIIFGLTITFAGFDWLMSLSPEWYSTMFGVYTFAGTVTSSFSVLVLTAVLLRRQGLLADTITMEHYHDLGKLIFGFIVFWTYIGFSQYMLIWYSNIPEETEWFAARWEGSWMGFSILLIFAHFVVPFFTTISRNAKRSLSILPAAAALLVVAHYLDLYWMVMPNLHKHGVSPHWLDLTSVVGTSGLFLGLVARRLSSVPLVPVKDPYLQASLEFENA